MTEENICPFKKDAERNPDKYRPVIYEGIEHPNCLKCDKEYESKGHYNKSIKNFLDSSLKLS